MFRHEDDVPNAPRVVVLSHALTFAATAAVLVIVAFVASYLPARRAMRVDPMAALRAE